MRRSARCVASLALAVLAAAPAAASPETLKRASSNTLFGPLDVVLSPITAAHGLYLGLRDQDDSPGVRIVWTLPGYVFNFGTQAGAGAMRILSGLLELVPGLGLYFFEADLDPIFAPADRAEAWVDVDTRLLYVKFGLNYTAPAGF